MGKSNRSIVRVQVVLEVKPVIIPDRYPGQIIGVIDLKDGVAVHGIAGRRAHYCPVAFCEGNSIQLAQHYLDIGVKELYVADLDSLRGGQVQWEAHRQLLQMGFNRYWFDIGWREALTYELPRIVEFNERYPKLEWIIATESCNHLQTFDAISAKVGSDRITLSLDFINGTFLNHHTHWQQWLRAVVDQGTNNIIILDLAAVGGRQGVLTVDLCKQILAGFPHLSIWSGGGVRHVADIDELCRAGCRGVLMATALYPDSRSCQG